MIWYGDNSELKSTCEAPIPDILLFGGIAISREQSLALTELIRSMKVAYREQGDFPIKWNMRDLRSWFQVNGLADVYRHLLDESKEWRYRLLRASLKLDYRIIVSCVNFHSRKVEKIKENRDNVIRYTFCNALMRVGLFAQETGAQTFEVILDWPEANNHLPYTSEYRSAFFTGACDATPEIKYYCGPLKNLHFSQAPLFTRMEECPPLQFSDLILGTTRDFVEYCMGKKQLDHFGVELTKLLIPKYRGFPSRITGRGISIAPADGELSNLIFKGLLEIREV